MPSPPQLDLVRFSATPLQLQPFDYMIVPEFLQADALPIIEQQFPEITTGGSFPAQSLHCGPGFTDLLTELQGKAVRDAFAEKFSIDLDGRPTMITLRGQSRAKDGQIHTDSKSKLITALIYLNSDWESDGGRLRMLNGPANLEDYAAEVPPQAGTLVAFRCSETAYHGHRPFVGQRRSIQLNWMTDSVVLKRELKRHRLSAWTKRVFHFGA